MDFLPMITEKDGVPVTTSRVVAEQFGKRHDNVLRDIEALTAQLKNEGSDSDPTQPKIGVSTAAFAEENFLPTTYRDSTGRELPMYLLTRDGFTLLAMGFTGARAVQFKVAYINAFNRMERLISGGIRSSTMKQIEDRLISLEKKATGGRAAVTNSTGEIFLQAIREALASGEYYLRDRWHKHDPNHPGKILGVVDGGRSYILRTTSYELYAAADPHPLKPISLWALLENTGFIHHRQGSQQTRSVDGSPKFIITVDTDTISPR